MKQSFAQTKFPKVDILCSKIISLECIWIWKYLGKMNLLASINVTSLSSSRSFLFPTRTMTIAGLARVLASVNQLARLLKDSLELMSYTRSAPAAPLNNVMFTKKIQASPTEVSSGPWTKLYLLVGQNSHQTHMRSWKSKKNYFGFFIFKSIYFPLHPCLIHPSCSFILSSLLLFFKISWTLGSRSPSYFQVCQYGRRNVSSF